MQLFEKFTKKKKNPITFVRTMPNSGIAMRVHYLQL